MKFNALLLTSLLTAIVHTITGPDHYLPFIAIAKAKSYSLKKTLIWTFICGLAHIFSALLISLIFVYLSHLLNEVQFNWIEEHRSDLAGYILLIVGIFYFTYSIYHKYLHIYNHKHTHFIDKNEENISIWIIFIIFVLGPCEALLPVLTASSLIGIYAVIISTILFSIVTIATMMLMVSLGYYGINLINIKILEKYANELAGITIALCGFMILIGF